MHTGNPPLTAVIDPYLRQVTEVERVHDGDTLTVSIDLGFHLIMKNIRVRVNRIDAPELGTPRGIPARDHLRELVRNLTAIKTYPDPTDKYGRWLGELYAGDVNLNDMMVQDGFAVPYFGGKK